MQNAGQYLAIDFGKEFIVTRVMTQGRQGSSEYVTEFTLEFSHDNKTWTEYTNEFGITEVMVSDAFMYLLSTIFVQNIGTDNPEQTIKTQAR